MPLSMERAWLEDFNKRMGRPLRVLHIGNIANNAYRNAIIQRRIGIEATVVCYDYYHIMGCPEWEDTDLSGSYDAFMPDWWTLDAHGCQRPAWYVQGPVDLCLEFLRASLANDSRRTMAARRALIQAYATMLHGAAPATTPVRNVMASDHLATTMRLAPEIRASDLQSPDRQSRIPDAILNEVERYASPEWRRSLAHQTAAGLLDPALRRQSAAARLNWRDRATLTLYRVYKAAVSPSPLSLRTPAPAGYWDPEPSNLGVPRLAARYLGGTALSYALQPVAAAMSWWSASAPAVPAVSAPPIVALASETELLQLAGRFRAASPDLAPEACAAELASVQHAAAKWRDVMAHYDIIQGYSVDAALPLFAGHPNFVAYEHGTIRDIPFEQTARGRLCRFTYANVPRAFITNTDVMPSADRIPIAPSRRVCLPHALDDAKLLAFRRDHTAQVLSGDGVNLFSPTRHHWCVPDPSLNKGNDILLRGAARAVSDGHDIRLTLVEWGQHVDASKRLIEEFGMTGRVTWIPILNRAQLWSAYLSAHAVADQFTLPALGGVGYETLTLGARLITNLDQAALARFFGEQPPVFLAATPQDVAARIAEIAQDPLDVAARGRAGAEWAARFHSSSRILDLQIAAYRDILQRPASIP